MMFLHSGASLHGHEYSNRPPPAINTPSSPPAAGNLRSPLLRSALVPAKNRAAVDGSAPPILRQRPASDSLPRRLLTPEPFVRFQEVEEEEADSIAGMGDGSLQSDSELSEATAFSTDAPRRSVRRHRRVSHKSTRYFLGYPLPNRLGKTKVIQKVIPRLLLQLQRVSEDGRPRPVLEVFPSSRIAGPVIAPRLAKRFPGIFGVKRHLGYDDIVLVRRDDSDSASEGESEADESLERRDLVAVYSPLKHSNEAEIIMADGSVWVTKPRANGSCDFVHVDEHGISTTARWARRHAAKASAASIPTDMGAATAPSPTTSATRFTFSIINPQTRRHPVMATLTQSALEVQDTYTSVSSSYGRYPPHKHTGRTVSLTASSPAPWTGASPTQSKRSSVASTDGDTDSRTGAFLPEASSNRAVHPIDESTKTLISVTALWVALQSGWSATQMLKEPLSLPSASTRSSRRHTWSRATPEVGGRLTPQPADSEGPPMLCPKRNSMPLMATGKACIATISPSSTPPPTSAPRNPPPLGASTGATFIQRRNQTPEPCEQSGGKPKSSKCRSYIAGSGRERSGSTTVGLPDVVLATRYDDLDSSSETTRGMGGGKEDGGKKGVRTKILRWIHKLHVGVR